MNITILDGYTLNPGDLTWDKMNTLGNVSIYDRTKESEIIERCRDAEIVLTNKVVIDKNKIDKLPKLKYLGVLATGYNVVDIEAAKIAGIIVTNIPAYSTHSVAQLAIGLMIDFAEDLSSHIRTVSQGKWSDSDDFSYTTRTINELAGKKLGIIGYGQIAKQVIRIARSFEMKVLVYTSHPDANSDISFVSIEQLFSDSDIVSIHTSLRPENEHIINRDTLELMKPSAYLINTSRGGFINEQDLAGFLNENKIAGACLDVLSDEPPKPHNPLLKAKNCRITPHIAWSTLEARQRLLDLSIANIKAFQNGNPVNVVN
jgi:glycerate dehydrogenase